MLYYTFGALGGSPEAEITAGYRHWAGIGTKQSCGDALPFYKSAADKGALSNDEGDRTPAHFLDTAMARFAKGPPGGLHLPPQKARLSDADGGVYGSGASVVSAGSNAKQQNSGPANVHNPSTEQEWDDVLEFLTFHADRGDATFMFRLGRIYYQGFSSTGATMNRRRASDMLKYSSTGALVRPVGSEENGGRDYARSLKWFTRIARSVWPRDPQGALRKPLVGTASIGSYDAAKDSKMKVDEHQQMVAGLAAGYLGRMFLRGEGVPQDYNKAFLWFSRGLGQVGSLTYADFMRLILSRRAIISLTTVLVLCIAMVSV